MNSFAGIVSGLLLFILAASLGIIGLVRARARKRWRAAVDAYAEREVIRDRRRQAPRRRPVEQGESSRVG